MGGNFKTIQIAFNMDDPNQAKLYNFFKDNAKNASLYGKMLIQNEMNKVSSIEKDQVEKPIPVEDNYSKVVDGGVKVNSGGLKFIGGM